MSRAAEIRVAVIGAGSWGTTVASLAAANTPTTLWARRADLVDTICATRENPDYLAGFPLPEALEVTASIADAVGEADVVVMAVPSHGFRDVAREASPFLRPWIPVVSLSKGLEAGSLQRMTEVAADEMPGRPVGVMTGPNLAKEIMAGQPAASVVAIPDATIAAELQRILAQPSLRVYTNPDVVGCEVAGVVKNVIAIASGMAEGMGFGDNTRSNAHHARAGRDVAPRGGDGRRSAHVRRPGGDGRPDRHVFVAPEPEQLVGLALGRGQTIEEILASMNMVAEGVKSSPSVLDLARRYGVEMPITEQVVAVCHQGRTARDAVTALMTRPSTSELE